MEVKDDFGARMCYDYDCLGNLVLEERVIEEGVFQRIRYGYNKNSWRIRKTEDFQGALESASISGIKYGEIIVNGKWEFIFAPPRAEGQLPVIKHSVFSGWGE